MLTGLYRRIALALSMSPRREALLAEARRLADRFNAELIIIYVGKPSEHTQCHLEALLERHHLDGPRVRLIIPQGQRVEEITRICHAEGADLLIAGATPHRNVKDWLLGSVPHRLIKHAPCPVLLMPEPKVKARGPREIVVGTLGQEGSPLLMERAMRLAQAEGARRVHILRQDGLYDLAMASAALEPAQKLMRVRRELVGAGLEQARTWLESVEDDADLDGDETPHHAPEVTVKLIGARPGRAWVDYAHRHHADMLVIDAPASEHMSLLWRLGNPHYGFLMRELPCNLLVVK